MLRRAQPAGFIEPCISILAAKLPAGLQWVHEIKHDGYRTIVCRRRWDAPQDDGGYAVLAPPDPLAKGARADTLLSERTWQWAEAPMTISLAAYIKESIDWDYAREFDLDIDQIIMGFPDMTEADFEHALATVRRPSWGRAADAPIRRMRSMTWARINGAVSQPGMMDQPRRRFPPLARRFCGHRCSSGELGSGLPCHMRRHGDFKQFAK